jgi:hypothetical protein
VIYFSGRSGRSADYPPTQTRFGSTEYLRFGPRAIYLDVVIFCAKRK